MGAPPAASKGCPKGDVTSGGRATVRAVLVNRVDPSQFLRVVRWSRKTGQEGSLNPNPKNDQKYVQEKPTQVQC